MKKINITGYLLGLAASLMISSLAAQQQASVTIDVNKTGSLIEPTLHGVFFEEANIPPGMTLLDGFIVPPHTPHFSMPNNGISDWKMEWPIKSEYPAWTY